MQRSLCNTFGGCGGKRSLQQQSQQVPDYVRSIQVGPGEFEDGTLAAAAAASNKQSSLPTAGSFGGSRRQPSASALAEVINDLLDYMKNSERYKRGKYVLILAKQIDDQAAAGASSRASAGDEFGGAHSNV